MTMNIKQWYNNVTRNWRAAPNPAGVSFGYVNAKTLEFHAGYVTKGGEIKYEERGNKIDPWGEIEFLENRQATYWWSYPGESMVHERPISIPIYRQRHVLTNECRYFTGSPNGREYIDKIAYEANGTVVKL